MRDSGHGSSKTGSNALCGPNGRIAAIKKYRHAADTTTAWPPNLFGRISQYSLARLLRQKHLQS